MPIYKGTQEISALKLGNQDVKEVYLGSEKIWPTGPDFLGHAKLSFYSSSEWNAGNRLDLISAGVREGDLVLLAWAANAAQDTSLADNISGMEFTTVNNALSLNPYAWIAYGHWKNGDSNPYYSGNKPANCGASIVALIFRNVDRPGGSLKRYYALDAPTVSGREIEPVESGSQILIGTINTKRSSETWVPDLSGWSYVTNSFSGGGLASSVFVQYKFSDDNGEHVTSSATGPSSHYSFIYSFRIMEGGDRLLKDVSNIDLAKERVSSLRKSK